MKKTKRCSIFVTRIPPLLVPYILQKDKKNNIPHKDTPSSAQVSDSVKESETHPKH